MYVDEAKRIRTPTSKITFTKTIHTLDSFLGGNADLDACTAQALTDWCMSGNKPAPSTVKKRRAHIRSMFAWLTWRGIVEVNPSTGLEFSVNPGRGYTKEGVWLNEAQIAHVLDLCPNTIVGRRDRLVLMFGFFCGLRASEIAGIRWHHFSPDFSRLQLVGKGEKPATVGVAPALARELVAWRETAPADAVAVFPTFRWCWDEGLDGRVRRVDWSNPLAYHGILYAVGKAGKRGGFHFAPHDMRRSFAGLLEEKGVAATDISRAMRHSNLGTTSRYLDRNPNKAVEVTANLTIGDWT
jgi:integrase